MRPGKSSFLVELGKAEPHNFTSRLEVLGELKPDAAVEVMSRISGRLHQVLVNRGDHVKKGQLVAVVEDADLQQQIQRAKAAVLVARAGANREKANLDNLKIQLQRYQKLHDDRLISTQELQDLNSRTQVANAQLELAKAQVEQAEASLRELQVQLSQTLIYSPLDGFVGVRHLDPGALVSPSVSIVSILKLNRVKTVVPVAETVLREVRVGLAAEITVDAYPGKSFRGKVTRISPVLDSQTRSAEVEIEIPNLENNLKAGMFARVNIDVGVNNEALAVPRSALLTRGTEKGVYLLSRERTAMFQPIEIGRIQGDYVEVVSGLDTGTEVITTGAQMVNEGDPVNISKHLETTTP